MEGTSQQPGSNNPAQNDSPDQNQPGGLGGGPGLEELLENAGRIAPLTGDEYMPWSDRLRDVEEMLDDPTLRAEAARIRDRARAVRANSSGTRNCQAGI